VFFWPEVIYSTLLIKIIKIKIVVKSYSHSRRLTSHITLFTYLVVVLEGDDFVGAASILVEIELLEWVSGWFWSDRAGEVGFDLFCCDELRWIGLGARVYCPGGAEMSVQPRDFRMCRVGLHFWSVGWRGWSSLNPNPNPRLCPNPLGCVWGFVLQVGLGWVWNFFWSELNPTATLPPQKINYSPPSRTYPRRFRAVTSDLLEDIV
jgi:hypothetical protein